MFQKKNTKQKQMLIIYRQIDIDIDIYCFKISGKETAYYMFLFAKVGELNN